jgi:hypothetical protein
VIAPEDGLGLMMIACRANMAATIMRQWMNIPVWKKQILNIQVINKMNAVINKILFIVAVLYTIDKMVPV